MNKRSFKPQARNAQAIRTLFSWARATGIGCRKSLRAGCDAVLRCADGSELEVALVMAVGEAPADILAVLAKELASPKMDVALKAFHVLTEAAGHGSPTPVDRGVKPKVYGDDFFLIAARHTEFRRAPNLSAEQIATYTGVVQRGCRTFAARNGKLLALHGYEVQDLETFAWIWTHNFVHGSEVQTTGDDNQRLLTKALRDQFFFFFTKLQLAQRAQFPDPDTVHICLRGQIFDENHDIEKYSSDPRLDAMPAGVQEDSDEAAEARRRKAKAKILKQNLEALPHDTMIEKLKEQAESVQRDYSTRREARRLLLAHAKTCEMCAGMELGSLTTYSEEISRWGEKNRGAVNGYGGFEGSDD